jgi:hypothetical protein
MKRKSASGAVQPTEPAEIIEVSDAFDFNNSSGWHSIVEGSDDYLLKIMKGKCCEHCGDSKDLSFKISAKTLTIRCAFCHCVHIFPIEILDT